VPAGSRVLGKTAAKQSIGRAALDHPSRGGSVGVLDVDMDPRMRVDQLDLGDGSAQLQRFLRVELGREGVVCEDRHCGEKYSQAGKH
jgi:hypothetical protein